MSSIAGQPQPQPQPGIQQERTKRVQERTAGSGNKTYTTGRTVGTNRHKHEGPRWSAVKALVAAAVVAALTLALVVAALVFLRDDFPEMSLVLVFVASAVSLILVVAALAIVLTRLGLADRSEAMGLPSGTIRAIIALLLVVLFFIAAIFLFNGTQNQSDPTQTRTLRGITAERFATIPTDQIRRANTRAVGEDTVYDVVLFSPSSGTTTSDDLAKQLITTVGTLVTAVAAFYFGASSVQAARKEGSNAIVPPEDDDTESGGGGGSGTPSGGTAGSETKVEETKTTSAPQPEVKDQQVTPAPEVEHQPQAGDEPTAGGGEPAPRSKDPGGQNRNQ